MTALAILTLFYLPVHFVLGIKFAEGLKHTISQFLMVLAWPVLVPVTLIPAGGRAVRRGAGLQAFK